MLALMMVHSHLSSAALVAQIWYVIGRIRTHLQYFLFSLLSNLSCYQSLCCPFAPNKRVALGIFLSWLPSPPWLNRSGPLELGWFWDNNDQHWLIKWIDLNVAYPWMNAIWTHLRLNSSRDLGQRDCTDLLPEPQLHLALIIEANPMQSSCSIAYWSLHKLWVHLLLFQKYFCADNKKFHLNKGWSRLPKMQN